MSLTPFNYVTSIILISSGSIIVGHSKCQFCMNFMVFSDHNVIPTVVHVFSDHLQPTYTCNKSTSAAFPRLCSSKGMQERSILQILLMNSMVISPRIGNRVQGFIPINLVNSHIVMNYFCQFSSNSVVSLRQFPLCQN